MRKVSVVILLTAFILVGIGTSCTSTQKHEEQPFSEFSRRSPSGVDEAVMLSEQAILKASSSGKLKLSEAHVIIDNEAAFASKLKAIQEAKSGDEIRMVYYIYTDDESSSLFTQELISAANRRVSIRLMVDYLTNYKYFDLFKMMKEKGNGNIEVKLYGRPSALILRDALFMTSTCPLTNAKTTAVSSDDCSNEKWNSILAKTAQQPEFTDFFSRLFLAGISAKNALALKVAILGGQEIDLAKYKDVDAEPEKVAKLKEFLKLAMRAKIDGKIEDRLKVQIALLLYASDLNPVLNDIYGKVPISQMAAKSYQDWEHISDYNHHKLLLVSRADDSHFFQLGGRNIENSYHINKNTLTSKYIFDDTDFAAEIAKDGGGEGIEKSFDQLWNFKPMSVDLDQVEKFAPFDFVGNQSDAGFVKKVQNCLTIKGRDGLQACVTQLIDHEKDSPSRIEAQYATMNKRADLYLTYEREHNLQNLEWKNKPKYSFSLDKVDLEKSLVSYVENLHFAKTRPQQRILGTMNQQRPFRVENESAYGRHLHQLWVDGLENTCASAAKEQKEKRVILHSAYFLPPARIIDTFTKMMDGTWNCQKVRVTILTNSMGTTDLGIINLYARYQMKGVLDQYAKYRKLSDSATKSARFDYYEYKQIPNQQKVSLHSKVSILGDDVIVGSANADIRSYYMDTNNGVFIRNAREFVSNYVAHIDEIIQNSARVNNLSLKHEQNPTGYEVLHAQDYQFLNAFLQKYGWDTKIQKEAKTDILSLQTALAKKIINATQIIMDKQNVLTDPEDPNQRKTREDKSREVQNDFNQFLQVL